MKTDETLKIRPPKTLQGVMNYEYQPIHILRARDSNISVQVNVTDDFLHFLEISSAENGIMDVANSFAKRLAKDLAMILLTRQMKG